MTIQDWIRDNTNSILQRLATNVVWTIVCAVVSAVVWVGIAVYQKWSVSGVFLGVALIVPAVLWSGTWLWSLLVTIAGSDVVRHSLLGTWSVTKGNYQAEWTFSDDGFVASNKGEVRGRWKLEPSKLRVYIDWGGKSRAWESFTFSLNPTATTGESWSGEVVHAIKQGHHRSTAVGQKEREASTVPDKRRRMEEVIKLLDEMIRTGIPDLLSDERRELTWFKFCSVTLRECIQDQEVANNFDAIMNADESLTARMEHAVFWLRAFKSRVREQDIRWS